jgi:shikimate kinase
MNIALTGFMGSGKTAVGTVLAAKLGRKFLDTDAMIEEKTGISIKEFFEKSGEAEFRKIEYETVKEAAQYKDAVISCGGGAVLNPLNIEALRKKGLIINLFASPEEIYKRVKGGQNRPLLNCPDPVFKIRELLKNRESFYAGSDYSFDTDGLSVGEIAAKILSAVSDKI